jgi:hypothetical protein
MSITIFTRRPHDDACITVSYPADDPENIVAGTVRIETAGRVLLGGREMRMLAARLIRWSRPRPKK